MLRRFLPFVVIGMCIIASLGADTPSAKDAQELQGEWQTIELEGNGEKKTSDQVSELQVIIKGDCLDVKPDGEGRKTRFKLDASKSPKAIDVIPSDGPQQGKLVAGIYSLEDGKLKIC